ncbi:MAG: hypothetical protein JKX89_10895 [Idiomarina sp.]|nr:hypothetical protein [Idiomarina sp.]
MDTSHHTTEINELGHSPDAQQERQQQLLNLLRQTAPEVISDNQLNLERLKELMGEERLAPAEHYELSWAGKKGFFVTSCGFGLIEQAAHWAANQVDHGDEVGLVPVAACA